MRGALRMVMTATMGKPKAGDVPWIVPGRVVVPIAGDRKVSYGVVESRGGCVSK